MMKYAAKLKRFIQNSRASTMIEFAIVLPVILILFFGILEITRAIIIHQKIDKMVHAMADFTTQSQRSCVEESELDAFNIAAESIMNPFEFNGRTTIIFNSISASLTQPPPCTRFPNRPCILWSYTSIGTDTTRVTVDRPNRTVTIKGEASFRLRPGKSAIVTEIYYQYEPMLSVSGNFIDFLRPMSIYRHAVYVPRTTALTSLRASCPPPTP